MCGIAGAVADRTDAGDVLRMLKQLSHRGPDDEGVDGDFGAFLGVRRLSIIDVAGGHQPMWNEDRTIVAVQNGEIYNFRELRERLVARGHTLHTRSDTEVLPHLYEDHGPGFVEHLHGMFALALWDTRQRQLVLARDRLGKKPLVYAQVGEELRFASEIGALFATGQVTREVDDAAIDEYLAYGYVPAPRTGFAAIRKLPPASVAVFRSGEMRVHRYWRVAYEPKIQIPREELIADLRVRIHDAVRMRLVSDVPLGALLSGGLDSSAVVAFMARDVPRVRTFSIGFEDRDFNELRYARLVAAAFDTDHHEFVVSPPSADILPMLVRHVGEPFADSSLIPTYHVARIAREHVTVVLNGDGGDELFGGYPRYRAVALASALNGIPGLSVALGTAASFIAGPLLRERRLARTKRLVEALALTPDERYMRWMGYFTGAFSDVVRNAARSERVTPQFFASLADETGARSAVDRAMAADLLAYLPGDLLVKMDIATMAASLEARSPFLDHRLVEFMARLPWSYKVSARTTKRLFRDAMRGILPNEVIHRSKMGFGVPVGRWLRGPMRPLIDDVVLSPAAFARGYLDEKAVRRIVREHLDGVDRTPFLWALVMLELWFREMVEAPLPAAHAVLGRDLVSGGAADG